MGIHYSGGLLVTLLSLTLVIALPVKIAAHFAQATRTGFLWCITAVALGVGMGYLASLLFGGVLGAPLVGYLGFVFGIRLVLGTSFVAAIGLSVVAFVLALLGISLLGHLGVITASPDIAVNT